MHHGQRLDGRKDLASAQPIEDAPHFPTLSVSMLVTDAFESLVDQGESIQRGQLLARSNARRLHAPVSGTLIAIERRDDRLTMTIANDFRDTPHADMRPIRDYAALSAEELRVRIEDAGIVGLGGAMFPTARKLTAAALHHPHLLIINGIECEPFIACDDALLRAHADDVVLGAEVLLHATGADRAIIAIEDDMPAAINATVKALNLRGDSRLQIQTVPSIYPAGGERQVIQTLTGREVPSGGIPPDIGVLCQNVGTAAAVARLVQTGEPLISRIMTLTGGGIERPHNLRVRIGTLIAELINHVGGYGAKVERLIMGGSMMGIALADDAVAVSAATNCIVVANSEDLTPRGLEMPCIRCGDCADVCPANLLPQQLHRYAQVNDRAALQELGLRDCIECGCCDYVCPSRIRLVSTFIAAKNSLEREG